MPSQIMVEKQCIFEEESHLSYEVSMAPDPPPSSLSRIVEDDYPDSSSEEGSVSSMVARGSMVSETLYNATIDSPKEARAKSVQKTTPKKGGRSKVERWRKANIQRLKQNQHLLNEKSPIEEEKYEDGRSVDSDQATYSSKSTSEKPVIDEKVSKSNPRSKNGAHTAGGNGSTNSIVKSIVKDGQQKKNPDGQSLVFDSIFTRRIEKRRAAKLKNNNSEERSFDFKPDSTSVKDSTENNPPLQPKAKDSAENLAEKSKSSSLMESRNVSEKAAIFEMPRNDNTVHEISSSSSHDGIQEPITTIPDSNPHAETLNQSAPKADFPHASSVIEAVAAAAALALNKDFQAMENPSYPSMENPSNPSMENPSNPSMENPSNSSYPSMENPSNPSYPSMENPSFDKEDTENRVPPHVVKGKDGTDAALPRQKNPFQDDDVIDEEDIYEYEADAYPLLTSSSSEIADVLQPVFQTNSRRGSMASFHSARGISSPLASRRGPPMTPSPRRSSRLVASPRHFNEWNDTMHSPSSRVASTKLERCPSGMLNRTDSIKCADSADAYDALSDGEIETEFFDSSMYNH
jgi:hypothetical protein